jgi:hypothetical protein
LLLKLRTPTRSSGPTPLATRPAAMRRQRSANSGVGVAGVAFDHGYLVGVEIQRAEETAQGGEGNVHGRDLGLVGCRCSLTR